MALSMDEQRMLAEIERRLSAEDPRLAARLSSFRRPGPAAKLLSPRGRVIGSLCTVALLAVVSMMVYAMMPFRAHNLRSTTPQASGSPGVSAPVPARIGPPATRASTAAKATPATKTSTAAAAGTAKGAAAKTTAGTGASVSTLSAGRTSGTKIPAPTASR